jgi:hypothetical protein
LVIAVRFSFWLSPLQEETPGLLPPVPGVAEIAGAGSDSEGGDRGKSVVKKRKRGGGKPRRRASQVRSSELVLISCVFLFVSCVHTRVYTYAVSCCRFCILQKTSLGFSHVFSMPPAATYCCACPLCLLCCRGG